MSSARDARTCVRSFLGEGTPTPEALGRLMEYFYIHDFTPLNAKVDKMSAELAGINETLLQWRISLRTLVIVCTIIGGLISATGTVVGIYFALR